jgi:hypothetical protein
MRPYDSQPTPGASDILTCGENGWPYLALLHLACFRQADPHGAMAEGLRHSTGR